MWHLHILVAHDLLNGFVLDLFSHAEVDQSPLNDEFVGLAVLLQEERRCHSFEFLCYL